LGYRLCAADAEIRKIKTTGYEKNDKLTRRIINCFRGIVQKKRYTRTAISDRYLRNVAQYWKNGKVVTLGKEEGPSGSGASSVFVTKTLIE